MAEEQECGSETGTVAEEQECGSETGILWDGHWNFIVDRRQELFRGETEIGEGTEKFGGTGLRRNRGRNSEGGVTGPLQEERPYLCSRRDRTFEGGETGTVQEEMQEEFRRRDRNYTGGET